MWLEGRLERPRTIFPSPQSAVSTASAHLTSLRSESIDHMLVKRSGGYIRNHRPSEQRRLSRLCQRPGRSAGCRSYPSNRARQKARQPASPRPRTRSSNPVPSSAESHKLDHRDPASGAMRGETFRLSRSTPGAGHDEGTGFERDCLMTSPMATFLGRCVAESYLDGSRGRSRAVPV